MQNPFQYPCILSCIKVSKESLPRTLEVKWHSLKSSYYFYVTTGHNIEAIKDSWNESQSRMKVETVQTIRFMQTCWFDENGYCVFFYVKTATFHYGHWFNKQVLRSIYNIDRNFLTISLKCCFSSFMLFSETSFFSKLIICTRNL